MGIYESLAIIAIFPLIVAMEAGSSVSGKSKKMFISWQHILSALHCTLSDSFHIAWSMENQQSRHITQYDNICECCHLSILLGCSIRNPETIRRPRKEMAKTALVHVET